MYEKILNNLNKLNNFYYYFSLFLFSILLFLLSENIYEFDLDIINKQDARYYIKLANNPLDIVNLNPYYSSRILSPLLVYFLNNFFGIDLFYSFKILVIFVFFLLNSQIFNYLSKSSGKIESVLVVFLFSSSNWILIYNFFNPYQLIDLISILIVINILFCYKKKNYGKLLIWCLAGVLNKHYLIILIFFVYFDLLIKNKFNRNIVASSIIVLISFFLLYFLAGLNIKESSSNLSILELIDIWIIESINKLPLHLFEFINDKQYLYLLPFIFLFFNRRLLNIIKRNYPFFIYTFVITILLIIMYDKFRGENFSRVFYQSLYPLLIIIFLDFFNNYKTSLYTFLLLLSSSVLICLEYIIFILDGSGNFVSYMLYERYNNFYSSIYLSSFIIIILKLTHNEK